ncbi:response regulator [Sphingomonas sp. SAFR-052]|uniref:response regulator n=1 Tax=Sphingomonas sp. SAFR-052 TaxID=3436867 RepID=UPI003F7E1895
MPLSDCHILVVEDEYLLARDLQIELEDAGAIVIGLEGSSESALDKIRNTVKIDAVILDLNLGGKNAFGVADELMARQIPFIFASGYDNYDAMLRYPAAINCMKPYSAERVIRLLKQVLAPRV